MRWGWLRLDIVRLLVLALPALGLNWILLEVTLPFSESPGRAALLLLPLLALVVFLAVVSRRDSTVNLGTDFLLFFLAFCLFFSVATASDVLTGKRILLAGDEREVPRGLPGLSRLGDWHYWFAAGGPPVDDLVIVTFPSFAGEFRAEVRRKFAFLIRQAIENDAKGVAFDYFLEEESPAADPLLGGLLAEADAAGIPYYFGYRHRMADGKLERQELAPSLAGAIPPERQGHLSGFRESDGRVRMVPLALPDQGQLRAFSERIAESLHGGELPPPPGRLLQYTRPRYGVPVKEFAPDRDWSVLRNRFVLVGTASPTDRVETPYGESQGVEVHAFAANSLRSGRYISRLDSRLVFPMLFTACYLITVLHVRGFSTAHLLAAASALTVVLVASAALAMRAGLVWIDLSYQLVALWTLMLLVVGIRGVRRVPPRGCARPVIIAPALAPEEDGGRPGSPVGPDLELALGGGEGTSEAGAEGGFDVFLSHNSRDKPRVRELARALVARELKPWLDEWELVPGRSWQSDLEEVIRTVRSSAVIVGERGLGPWEIPELRASLSESVRRGLPVIPVLLPGAAKRPVLPLFLTQFTWVDLRAGLTEEGLDRLEWGITGEKPAR